MGNIYQLADGTKAKCYLYDTNGQEQFDALSNNYYQSADGCLLVYDITNRESFESIKKNYIPKIKQKCQKNIKVILIGNKCELSYDREVERDEGGTFAVANNFQFQETSCVDNINVDKAFQAIIEVTIFERKNDLSFKKTESITITKEKSVNNNNTQNIQKKKSSC